MNVQLKNGFKQVCVWPATLCSPEKVAEFEQFILDEFGTRVQYLEEIRTYPDYKDGRVVDGTGGRNDLFFAVHTDDVGKFAVPRLGYGIRWLEDMFGNGHASLYPGRIVDYMCWDGYRDQYRQLA